MTAALFYILPLIAVAAAAIGTPWFFAPGMLWLQRRHHDHLIPGTPRSYRVA